MHTYTPANSIFDGPISNLLSILCSLIEIISRALAKGWGSFNDFKFGTFIGHFQSDAAACMAVKGLSYMCLDLVSSANSPCFNFFLFFFFFLSLSRTPSVFQDPRAVGEGGGGGSVFHKNRSLKY